MALDRLTQITNAGITSGITITGVNLTGVITATSASVSGNVSIAGTLTCEDITNIDSIGIITARSGVTVGAGLSVVGVSTLGITNTTNLTTQQFNVTGISTFANGPVLIGSGTSTGTASQPLQVTGSAYVSGNLGVGATNPTAKLDISGDFIGRATTIRIKDSGNTSQYLAIYGDSSSGHINAGVNNLVLYSAGTERARLDSSGNLGIGTANPSQKLEVVGGEIKAGRVDSTSEGGQVSFARATDNATGWYIDVYGNTSTPQLRFVDVSGSAVRATIDSSGNFQFNSGYGSVATAYGCRAWVNFNGTGSIGANQTIRGSGNVSTVYKNATGDYTVNFTTSMPDANFSAVYVTGSYVGGNVMGIEVYATGSVRIQSYTYSGGSAADKTFNNVAVFR
jgi:hypothetical protein